MNPIILAVFLTAAVEMPAAVKALKPELNARLRWREVLEDGLNKSGPEIFLRTGIFPQFGILLTGFELSTQASTTDYESLGNQFETKEFGLSQAYVGIQWGKRNFNLSGLAGKFACPTLFSPLIYNSDIRPEGFFESVSYNPAESSWAAAIVGAQYSLDQTAENKLIGQNQKRSWIFQQGLMARYRWNDEFTFESALHSYFFFNLSEKTRDLGIARGNSATRATYRPLEAIVKLEAKPLGLFAALDGAFIWNPSTDDDQRGFWIQGTLGKKWKEDNFSFDASYIYSEPDSSLAALSDSSLGYQNRKGTRVRLHYFPFDFFRLGASYAYLATIAPSTLQKARQDLRGEFEVKF